VNSAFGIFTLLDFLQSKPSVLGKNHHCLQYGDILINEVKIAIWLERLWQFINIFKFGHLSSMFLSHQGRSFGQS